MTHDWSVLRLAFTPALNIGHEDEHGFVGITAAGRQIVVEHARGLKTQWLVLRTPIGLAAELDAARVLERSSELALAVAVLSGGIYWLRMALPFDSVELGSPPRLVALLVDAAARLWPHQRPPLAPPAAFFERYGP